MSSAPFVLLADVERVHFSPSRTSRSVGCLSKIWGGAHVAFFVAWTLEIPTDSLDGMLKARGRYIQLAFGP